MICFTPNKSVYELISCDIPLALKNKGDIETKYVSGEAVYHAGKMLTGIYHDKEPQLYQVGFGCPLIYSDSWYVTDNLGMTMARFHDRNDAILYCERLIEAGWYGNTFAGGYLPEYILWCMGSV